MKKYFILMFVCLVAMTSFAQRLKYVYTLPYTYTATSTRLLTGDPIYIQSTRQLFPAAANLASGGTIPTSWYNPYQKVDSVSGTAYVVGKEIVGVWTHNAGTLTADTISISALPIGSKVTIIRLGCGGTVAPGKVTIKTTLGHANLGAHIFPNGSSTTGATTLDLTAAAPSKTIYRMDATHFWVK